MSPSSVFSHLSSCLKSLPISCKHYHSSWFPYDRNHRSDRSHDDRNDRKSGFHTMAPAIIWKSGFMRQSIPAVPIPSPGPFAHVASPGVRHLWFYLSPGADISPPVACPGEFDSHVASASQFDNSLNMAFIEFVAEWTEKLVDIFKCMFDCFVSFYCKCFHIKGKRKQERCIRL